MDHSTVRAEIPEVPFHSEPVPGVVVIFSGEQPRCAPIALERGSMEIGRGSVAGIPIVDDSQMSRRHMRIGFDGSHWTVEDLGSTNGTFVDGEPCRKEIRREMIRVVRCGKTVFLLLDDIRRFVGEPTFVESGVVIGPTLRRAYQVIAQAAAAGDSLLVTGESGTGKELAARTYHRAGPQSRGPFIAVNCAAIPEGLAERLLFGARRGAYSGATHDTEGYVQAAHGGTLFLDEVAELDAAVQAKLLRTIETSEVLELGAVAPRPVQVRVCAATHDLRARVASGQFREDLYYRIGRPEVRLLPLRERLEEIPWLLAECCRAVDERSPPVVDASLVIACALRPWPGNVRELVGEARRMVTRVLGDKRHLLEAKDLDEVAGMGITASAVPVDRTRATRHSQPEVPQDEVAEALRLEKGNVSRAANRLGVHRNKVRRWLERNGLDRSVFGGNDD